jgi:hypothetical protein
MLPDLRGVRGEMVVDRSREITLSRRCAAASAHPAATSCRAAAACS